MKDSHGELLNVIWLNLITFCYTENDIKTFHCAEEVLQKLIEKKEGNKDVTNWTHIVVSTKRKKKLILLSLEIQSEIIKFSYCSYLSGILQYTKLKIRFATSFGGQNCYLM